MHSTSLDNIEDIKHTTMTDMWAFGMVISVSIFNPLQKLSVQITLYIVQELLTGEKPYTSIKEQHVPIAILGGRLPQEPSFKNLPNRFIFRGLWAIGRNCWHDDPLKRPSALDILDELKSFMNGLGNERNDSALVKVLSLLPNVWRYCTEARKLASDSTGGLSETNSVHEVEELESRMQEHKISSQVKGNISTGERSGPASDPARKALGVESTMLIARTWTVNQLSTFCRSRTAAKSF